MSERPNVLSVKPRLRGVSHEIACYAAGFGGCSLVAQARGPGTTDGALWTTVIYSFCLFFLLAVSALYHRPTWGPEARARMRRLDHSAIYLLIAGTGTPVLWLTLSGATRLVALSLDWAGAALGLGLLIFTRHPPKGLAALAYVLMGFAIMPLMPQIADSAGLGNALLIVAGGVVYAIGATVYAIRKPDPLPTVFGYHEIFHAMVIIAAACHYYAIWRIVHDVARMSIGSG